MVEGEADGDEEGKGTIMLVLLQVSRYYKLSQSWCFPGLLTARF